VAKALGEKAAEIDACLIAVQGKPVDTGGCCHPDKKKVSAALRPCPNLNAIIDAL
jgi:isocitrate dehydrogenase